MVEITDARVQLRIKGGRLVLHGLDGKLRYTLTPNDRSKKLEAGSYTILVEGATGLMLDPSKFILRKGGTVTVRVTMRRPIEVKSQQQPPENENPQRQPLAKEITNSIGMKLVRIPAGRFRMGSPEGEGWDHERPEHEVEITKAFHMGAYEVTQKQFKAVMGYNPSHFSPNGEGKPGVTYFDLSKPAGAKNRFQATDDPDRFPVENVSWEEANAFCDKLSAIEKEKKSLYRLPTEAEWEYACRGGAGIKTRYHFGQTLSSTQANFSASKLGRTCTVGSYEPNGFGLYDMHGNVWERCSDRYSVGYYATSPAMNPPGSVEGPFRVNRGGSWDNTPEQCSAGYRSSCHPALRYVNLGFRLLLSSAPGQ